MKKTIFKENKNKIFLDIRNMTRLPENSIWDKYRLN